MASTYTPPNTAKRKKPNNSANAVLLITDTLDKNDLPTQHRAMDPAGLAYNRNNNTLQSSTNQRLLGASSAPRNFEEAEIQPRRGATPYARAGEWPFLALALICLGLAAIRRRTGDGGSQSSGNS